MTRNCIELLVEHTSYCPPLLFLHPVLVASLSRVSWVGVLQVGLIITALCAHTRCMHFVFSVSHVIPDSSADRLFVLIKPLLERALGARCLHVPSRHMCYDRWT